MSSVSSSVAEMRTEVASIKAQVDLQVSATVTETADAVAPKTSSGSTSLPAPWGMPPDAGLPSCLLATPTPCRK